MEDSKINSLLEISQELLKKYPDIKTNYNLLSLNGGLWNIAWKEAMKHYENLGWDLDDVGFKEFAAYVNTRPFPYLPKDE